MAEYGVPPEPRQENTSFGDQARAVLEWFLTPDDTGNLIPPTIVKSVGEEIDDQLSGRADNNFAEKKGIEKGIAKVIRSGTLTDILDKLLFGDNKAGAPDPELPNGGAGRDPAGHTYVVDADGNLVEVQMLPVWTRDP